MFECIRNSGFRFYFNQEYGKFKIHNCFDCNKFIFLKENVLVFGLKVVEVIKIIFYLMVNVKRFAEEVFYKV